MKKHENFLEFNGKTISFIDVDGIYWIAIKPICEALNIDANRSYQNVKNDPILAPEVAIQQMQVSKNGKTQLRNVTCIPEKFIYGWIFSLRSDSQELTTYKKTCYELLYNHFHGTITKRKELLELKAEKLVKKDDLLEKLKETTEYKAYLQSKQEIAVLNKDLNTEDYKIVSEKIKTLFEQDFIHN